MPPQLGAPGWRQQWKDYGGLKRGHTLRCGRGAIEFDGNRGRRRWYSAAWLRQAEGGTGRGGVGADPTANVTTGRGFGDEARYGLFLLLSFYCLDLIEKTHSFFILCSSFRAAAVGIAFKKFNA